MFVKSPEVIVLILKKTAAAVMASAMILGSAAPYLGTALTASAAENRSGVCTWDYVDVRNNADLDAKSTGWLDKGDNIGITEEEYDEDGKLWYKITYVGGTGYVPAETISESSENNTTDFESYLSEQGFPESYKRYLRQMHEAHPSWVFKAQKLGIDWNKAVMEESVIGRNLVHKDAPDSWKSMEKGAYDFDEEEWYELDTGFVAASQDIIRYYLDPRNFLSDKYIFMFENLSYDPSIQTIDGVEAILKGSFMDGYYTCPDTGETLSYAQTFMDAAKESEVSPYHLASRCRNEQGTYGAPQSLGTVSGYENYFNFFDVQAFATATLTAGEMAARYAATEGGAYMLPWTNQYKSIIGGSIFLGKGYINKEQDTLYLQKFDMTDGGNGYFAHQYMTRVFGQANEASGMINAYSSEVLNSAIEFKIPVYDNMPEENCLKPGATRDSNDYLSNLSVSGTELSPAFNKYTQAYTAQTTADSIVINASSFSGDASVTGIGSYELSNGTNSFSVTCTSAGGTSRVYTINVEKIKTEEPKQNVEKEEKKSEEPQQITNNSDNDKKEVVTVNYDLNGDGSVNVTDAVLIISHISGKKALSANAAKLADVDSSGDINIADAMKIINWIKMI